MKVPKITVLMPVHNGERYIEDAIESILAQTYTEYEIIIINDGSTDDSMTIIKSYNDTRIRIVHNYPKMGIVYSLNQGLSLARGDYVARMDCDDISLPHRFEKQIQFMEANPQVAICGSWVRVFGAESYLKKYPEHDEVIRTHLLFESPFAHPAIMMRRNSIIKENLAYRESFQHAEDYDLWSRVPRSLKFANLPIVLLKYRKHNGQVTNSFREKQLSISNMIRVNKLMELGIYASDRELDIHVLIARRTVNSSLEYIDIVKRWLINLYNKNNESKRYQEAAMLETLGLFWWESCFNSSGLGLVAWKSFKRCELSCCAHVDLKHQIAFLVKCFFKHEKSNRRIK